MPLYKDYNKAQLDHQYNNRARVPEFATYVQAGDTASEQTRNKYSFVKDVAYGSFERERLDIYPSSKPGSKTLVYIHGGYWQRLDKESFHFIAGAYLPNDITTVLITYPLAPLVSMDQIVLSCRLALQWVYDHIAEYNGNPDEIYVAGHSAGGHLAAMMLVDHNKKFPPAMIKGACVISGLYDLLPIQLSELNDVIKLSDDATRQNSPAHLAQVMNCPLIIAVGAAESEEFRDQSNDLYKAWKDSMVQIELLELKDLNHYTTVNAFGENKSALHLKMLEIMGI